jgi:MATE family multidrug resistance protein
MALKPVEEATILQNTQNPHKQIWAIAGPAIIANSSAPIVGLVDTWAIGHLPKAEYLAAIAVGSTIFTYIFWAFGFLRMGTTGHAAQAYGRSDIAQLAQLLIRSAFIGGLISLVLLLLQTFIFSLAITALVPPANVIEPLSDYYDIRIWAAPFTLFLYTANGFLIGTSKAKTVLGLQLLLNVNNMCLNLVFVIGLNLGVAGIALGTLIAEGVTTVAALYLILKQINHQTLISAFKDRLLWQARAFKPLLSTNFYLMIRTLLLISALSILTRQAGQLGESALAASQILSTFFMLISLGLDGFAYSAEALAGAAYGAKNRKAFEVWVKFGFYWAGLAAIFYSIAFYLFGAHIINILTNIDTIKFAANQAITAIIILPIASVWCFQYDGIYIGATASKAMMVTMIIAFFVFAAIILPLSDTYGLKGIWFALGVFMFARGMGQAVYYPRLKAKIIQD